MKRLRRSKSDRVIAGVCGGLGEYFDIDPVLIRIAWALAVFLGGFGLLAYVIAWIVIPEEGSKSSLVEDWVSDGKQSKKQRERVQQEGELLIGLILLSLGVILLLRNLGFWWSWNLGWPVTLIVIGLIIIIAGRGKK